MKQRYCPSCGTDVDVESIVEKAYVFIGCVLCGLGIGVRPITESDHAGPGKADALAKVQTVKRAVNLTEVVERPVPRDARSAGPSAPPTGRCMNRVFLVEDSGFLRQFTHQLLVERGLAREVIDCEDGSTFVETFTQALVSGEHPDLVVLDVRMPGVNGQEAAYAIRALEKVYGLKKATPILFFSALLCDEKFKAHLRTLGSARYIRKTNDDVQSLGNRVAEVLDRLLTG